MKRALHLLDTLRFGGAESVALNYARLMSQWEVDSVLSGRADSSGFERFASEYAGIKRYFSLRDVRQADYLFIHSNRNLIRLFLLRPFFRKRGKQVIYIQHLPYSESKFRVLAQIINRLCTGFIRISSQNEGTVGKYIRIPSAFVPNFYLPRHAETEYERIRRTVREESGISPTQKMVLFTGVLKPGKGLEDFLALAGRFAEDEHYRFVVAGDGQESARIRSYSHRNLHWVGWQADIERWLIASDVYCFCSRREMMPMALIEAQTLGLPLTALSSESNDYLLDSRTFNDVGDIEKALQNDEIPVIAPKYDTVFAAEVLKKLLGIDRTKKILHIQVLPKLTGVQRISLEIFRSLPGDGYEKTILFGGPENPHTTYCLDRFRETGAKVVSSGHLRREIGFHDWRAFLGIYRLCCRERFDVVHTHSTKPGIVGRIAARLAGVPLVVHTVHGVAFHRYVGLSKRLFYYAVEFFASFFAHRIMLVSAHYEKYFRVFRRKTTVVYNGLPKADNLARPVQLPEGPIRLLFVGRLEEAKDPLTLLRAFAWIVNGQNRRDFQLTVVGDGSLEAACREFVDANGLSEYVKMEGWQANTARFYTDHQIFCLSSIHEAFGLCLLEAGGHGLPVVATRVGGVPEVVREGITGVLVLPRDPVALAAAILRLADDSGLRERMGKAAAAYVREHFPSERMTGIYKRIYNNEL